MGGISLHYIEIKFLVDNKKDLTFSLYVLMCIVNINVDTYSYVRQAESVKRVGGRCQVGRINPRSALH